MAKERIGVEELRDKCFECFVDSYELVSAGITAPPTPYVVPRTSETEPNWAIDIPAEYPDTQQCIEALKHKYDLDPEIP